MKSNGALKPRLGASKKGSSPGIVLKEYRVKRYFKVNKNVVNGPPLNACGAKNNFINSTYNSINNQQRSMTSLSLQLNLKEKCGETPSSDICESLSRINYSTSIRVTKQIKYSIQVNPKRSRVSEASNNYLNSHKSHYNFLQKVTEAEAGAGVEAVAAIKKESEPKGFTNITAHQIDKTEFKEDIVRERNHYSAGNGRTIRSANKKANKFLFVPKINSNLKVIILWLSSELKLIFVSLFLHAIRLFAHFADNSRQTANNYSRAIRGYSLRFRPVAYNLGKIMRASQLLVSLFNSICLKNAKGTKSPIALFVVIYAATAILLPQAVLGDDGDTFFPLNGIETTTPEFDYASRGQKKFGDKCENTLECGFPGSICDPKKKSCQCTEDLPVTNHIDKCGKEAAVNESCFFNEQCEVKYFQTECRDQRCVCRFDMTPIWLKDGSVECKGRGDKKGPERYIDPAMIGVLIGMALMFIIICVVLRLFSQARWRENRTIFNTPNPRLMNVSLLRESKLLHGQERRGSRMSVRAPSRQPSMASLRPHSPNPSLGKTGRMTRSKSNNRSSESRVSDASNCSRLLEHHAANTHHASHSHVNANAISPHSSSTSHGAQTSASPISLNAPTTIITSINETPAAETTDSSTNLPTTKANKF